MKKAKFVMYVNTSNMTATVADKYLEEVKEATKDLREDGSYWAYVKITDGATRIDALPMI